jgi:hypothetical protein
MSKAICPKRTAVLTEREMAGVAWELCNRLSNDPDYAHLLTPGQWQQMGAFLESVRMLFTPESL